MLNLVFFFLGYFSGAQMLQIKDKFKISVITIIDGELKVGSSPVRP